MDETDVAICRQLIYNSRMSYSELADAVGISVQSAHRRVQDLVEGGVIHGFKAAFSLLAHRGIWVLVDGRSEAASLYKVLDRLEPVPGMDMVMVGCEKHLYISGVVLDPTKVNKFVSRVSEIAELDRPEVGMVFIPLLKGQEDPAIYPMDVRIIEALKDNARKPVTELARELGVAPRTVTRHIDRLMREQLVHFSIDFHAESSSDLFSALHLRVKKGQDREKVGVAIVKRLAAREVITYYFGDKPDQMIVVFWSPSIREIDEIVADLERSEVFEDVSPNLIMDVRYYPGGTSAVPKLRT